MKIIEINKDILQSVSDVESIIWIVLPAYNESENINELLRDIKFAMYDERLYYKVILVDDGSMDRTSEIAIKCARKEKIPLIALKHKANKGLGATIRDGLLEAEKRSHDRDIVISMDADNSHLPGLIVRMVRAVREGHDVVIASRYQPHAQIKGVSLQRRILSRFASLLFRLTFGITGVKDYTSGYRAYKSTALRQAVEKYGNRIVNEGGFQCMVDLLLQMRNLNLVFGEIPLILRYDIKKGTSKMNVPRTIINSLSLLVRRRLRE